MIGQFSLVIGQYLGQQHVTLRPAQELGPLHAGYGHTQGGVVSQANVLTGAPHQSPGNEGGVLSLAIGQ